MSEAIFNLGLEGRTELPSGTCVVPIKFQNTEVDRADCSRVNSPASHGPTFMRHHRPKLGDRIRLLRFPPIWDDPKYHVPNSTRAVYRKLITRRRPLVVSEVDERGLPWIECRFRGRGGRLEHHFLVVDDGCWVRVKPRRQTAPP
jgi:hypothetical protein